MDREDDAEKFCLLYSHYAIAGASAEFVQIRDIALSGFFFVLYNLGPGARSLDSRRYALPETLGRDWEPLSRLLLRLSLGIAFLVGGLFAGYDNDDDLRACRGSSSPS